MVSRTFIYIKTSVNILNKPQTFKLVKYQGKIGWKIKYNSLKIL